MAGMLKSVVNIETQTFFSRKFELGPPKLKLLSD